LSSSSPPELQENALPLPANAPLVVVLLSNTFERDSRVLKEGASAAADGFDVVILALPRPGLPSRERRQGVRIVRMGRRAHLGPFRWLYRAVWYGRTVLYCLRHRPAIVHVNDLDPLPAGWLAARFSGAKLVYDSHELWPAGRVSVLRGKWFRFLLRTTERFFARRCDAVFQATPSRAKAFAEIYGLSQPLTLRNCPTYQQPTPSDVLREKVGVPPEGRIAVYCGSVTSGRGIEPTLEALALLPDDVHLVFLGHAEPDYMQVLQAFCRQRRSLEQRVHWIPLVPYDQIIMHLVGADVGLCLIQNHSLSYYLSSPNKLFEYMMAGLPVVGSNFPEIGAVIEDADCGVTVDPDDPAAIAEAVRELLADPAGREAKSRNALCAAKRYCWENQCRDFLETYRRLAGKTA